MQIVGWILMTLQLLAAAALIAVIMSQATKSEGLSGTIGGKSQSAFRGKPGVDEKLGTITKYSAISFMFLSALVTFLQMRGII